MNQKKEYSCPICNAKNHSWLNVYYGNNSKLVKTDNMLITKCELVNDFVVINTSLSIQPKAMNKVFGLKKLLLGF